MNNILPQELINASKEDNLVIFVGAGLSYNFKNTHGQEIRDWVNLVKQMLLYLEQKHDVKELLQRVEQIENKTSNEQPIDILKSIEQDGRFLKKDIVQYIANFFHLPQDEQTNDYSMQQKLCLLSNIIITTNYDNAFEIANPHLSRILIGKNNPLQLLDSVKGNILFKLHGCVSQPDTMVLLDSDYDALYGRHMLGNIQHENALRINLAFQKLIINKTFLFIGCGMGDWQINYLFGGLKLMLGTRQKHFIISKESLKDELKNFLSLVPITDFSEIRNIVTLLLEEKEKRTEKEKIRNSYKNKSGVKKQKISITNMIEGLDLHLDKNYSEAILKYQKSIKFNPQYDAAYINLANAFYDLAKIRNQKYLYEKALGFYKKANTLQIQKESSTLYNWGSCMSDLAKLTNNEFLYKESIKKFKQSIKISPYVAASYNNLGSVYTDLAKRDNIVRYFWKGIVEFKNAVELDKSYFDAYYNWGYALGELASIYDDEELFLESFEKHKIAVTLNSNEVILNNWGVALLRYGFLKTEKSFIIESFEKFREAATKNVMDDDIYTNWGNALYKISLLENDLDKKLYYLDASLEKYEFASKLNAKNYSTHKNCGIVMSEKAGILQNEVLFNESIEKYKMAIALNNKDYAAYTNLGNVYYSLAMLINSTKKETTIELLLESVKFHKRAIKLNPQNDYIYMNYGVALSELAKLKKDNKLLQKSISQYKIASVLNPQNNSIFFNWGNSLRELAVLQKNEETFKQSFEKYKIAARLNPQDYNAYLSWANAMCKLAKLKKETLYYKNSLKLYKKAIALNENNNIAFTYLGAAFLELATLTNNATYYKKSCNTYQYITTNFNSQDDSAYYNWGLALLRWGSFKKEESLLIESIHKFQTVISFIPQDDCAYYNLGIALFALSKIKNKDKILFQEGLSKCEIAYKINNAHAYAISRIYALNKEKDKALYYLQESLELRIITASDVLTDDDWKHYFDDGDFQKLISNY